MHAGQHGAHSGQCTSVGASSLLPRKRLTTAAGLPSTVSKMSPFESDTGSGTGYAAAGQVLHQVQIKRQLFVGQTLKQRQHIFALATG